MSKYHAGKNGFPLCGSRRIDGFKTVVLSPSEWNKTQANDRCEKCLAKIKASKSQKEAAK